MHHAPFFCLVRATTNGRREKDEGRREKGEGRKVNCEVGVFWGAGCWETAVTSPLLIPSSPLVCWKRPCCLLGNGRSCSIPFTIEMFWENCRFPLSSIICQYENCSCEIVVRCSGKRIGETPSAAGRGAKTSPEQGECF